MSRLADQPQSVEEIIACLQPRVARRTVMQDLAWVRVNFPGQLRRQRAAGQHGTGRVAYGWKGSLPYVLNRPVTWLTEPELVALVAARGLLRDVHPHDRGEETEGDDHLASAVSGLINRAGVRDRAKFLARHTVVIDRFGAEPLKPGVLEGCLTAASLNEGLRFTYENLGGTPHPVFAVPQRLVLIKNEWYCLAWRVGGLRSYRLARMSEVVRCADKPAGCPASIKAEDLDAEFRAAFYATGGGKLTRVTLAVSPEAWPHVRNRRWGEGMQVDVDLRKLKKGWHRVSFVTAGLGECFHWVMSLGSGVAVESPVILKQWVRGHANETARHGIHQ